MIIKEIKEDLLLFLADEYFDSNWNIKNGKGMFNKGLEHKYKINNFSLGNFRELAKNFLLVQVKSIEATKSDSLGQIGLINFGSKINMLISIEQNTIPTNSSFISDLYIDTLYKRLQQFIYLYRNRITPINPEINISRYYDKIENTSNDINKITINANLIFHYKLQDLSLEEEVDNDR